MSYQWFRRPVKADGEADYVRAETTAQTIPWHGTSVLFSTAAAKSWTLGTPPQIGAVKTIICRKATTTNTCVVTLPGSCVVRWVTASLPRGGPIRYN